MSDLISRQAAIKYLITNMNWYDEDGYESDEDYKRRCITELINGVPSAQPEQKKGKWIKQNPMVDTEECSVCGYNILGEEFETPFCPICGARLMGEEE